MAEKRKPKPTTQASGGARLKAYGKRAVLLGIFHEEYAMIQEAAQIDGRPVTQFYMFHTREAAKAILKKSGKTS